MGPSFFRSYINLSITVKRRRMKTRKTKRKPTRKLSISAIKFLSADLLIEVLARVGSTSFTDLFNAKLCCREFRGAAENDYILQKLSMDKLPLITWTRRNEEISFLNRCTESGNPEALYRQGMLEYFSFMETESGLKNLKRAAEKGHPEALYVYGIILLCQGGQLKQQGLKLLNDAMSSKSKGLRIGECRTRIEDKIRAMWIKNDVVPQQLSCCNGKGCIIKKELWDRNKEQDGVTCCDACRWNQEVILFCNMIRCCLRV